MHEIKLCNSKVISGAAGGAYAWPLLVTIDPPLVQTIEGSDMHASDSRTNTHGSPVRRRTQKKPISQINW